MYLRLGLGPQVLLQHLTDHTHQAVAIWLGQAGPLALLIQRAGRRGGSCRSGMKERPLMIGLPLLWRLF